jgi:kynurenine formamidase
VEVNDVTRYLDLTQPLSPLTPRSSDHPEVAFPALRWYSRHGVKTREIHASLHAGTHVDTAALYFATGETIDQVSVDRLIGMALFVDCRLGEWGAITDKHLEERASDLKEGEILVLCTGWHHNYLDEEKYVLRGPGLDRSGVDWVAKRRPKAVCSDSPTPEHIFMRIRQWKELRPDVFGAASPDPHAHAGSYAHKTLLPLGILMVEGLGGEIDQLIGRRAQVFCLPAKYQGVEAAPVRVVAVVDD